MKFGKLPDITNVDFTLPPDSPKTEILLQNLDISTELAAVYIGCTGWSMKEWIGKVYPPKTPIKEFLWYYSRQFNTIELNTTHYRIPDQDTIDKWYKQSAPDFKFCPKVPQTISHSQSLALGTQLISSFCNAVAGLKEKLGCCFIQMPPYFALEQLPVLENFLNRWPEEIPLAVEFRDASWFGAEGQKAFDLLQKKEMATVITDVAGRRDVLHQNLTLEKALVRFVGNGLHPTDFQRIDAWVERLKTWLERGMKEVYFFTHEPDNILAPDLSLYLAEAVKGACRAKTRGPVFHEEKGGQISLF